LSNDAEMVPRMRRRNDEEDEREKIEEMVKISN
jgi:hypothetical protein